MQLLDSLFSLFSTDLGIDLGTANTLVFIKDKGISIREPSIVARHNRTKQFIAVGTEAKKMLGKTPASISAIRPLEHGVISDFDGACFMLSHYIKKIHRDSERRLPFLARPKVVVGIPSGVTEVERRAVWEAALTAGARECYLIEEPMAAAIGAGISVFEPTGVLIVDIGGGTTEIAVISLGGIVVNRSIKVAGYDMDQSLVHYIRLRHGLIIGEKTAEEVKIKIGSAYKKSEKGKGRSEKLEKSSAVSLPEETKSEEIIEEKKGARALPGGERVALIRGRSIETGLPKSLRITEAEVREAIGPVINEIIDGIMEVVEETPPELTSDILEHGILLTGGGALLQGIDDLIVERTKIPVTIVEDPLTTVVRGCAKLLEDEKLLSQVKVTGGLR